jgi:cysteine protease ATG4
MISEIEKKEAWIKYVEIVTRFIDSPTAPYSVQRIALQGVQFGIEVGQWFGPVTISHVLRVLIQDDMHSNLNIHVSTDGILFKDKALQDLRKVDQNGNKRALFIMLNLRLGIDVLNTVYHPLIKVFTLN